MPFAERKRDSRGMSDHRRGRQAPTLYVTATDPSIGIAGLRENLLVGGRGCGLERERRRVSRSGRPLDGLKASKNQVETRLKLVVRIGCEDGTSGCRRWG